MYDKNPLISVIIPSYNRASILPRAISSVLSQTYKNLELIIVDDASTDKTEEVVTSISDERIQYIRHEKNSNGSVARNTGIKNANGDYIAFLDSDDEWDKDKLLNQYKFYKNYNEEKTVCYTAMYEDNGFDVKLRPDRAIREDEAFADYVFSNKGLIQTSTLMIHKSILEKVKFNPNLRRHQDWDLCLQLERTGYNFVYLNKPLTTRYKEEDRLDRVTNIKDPTPSLYWIENNRDKMSERAYIAFLILTLSPLVGMTWDKKYVLKLLKRSFQLKSVSKKQWVKFCRFLFPNNIRLQLEKLLLKIQACL
ncbi:glycosyltransferase family 2 protein [Metabacillus indicus]|uniref:glycosyltransferase family 2 protein n=1 Tax=Metabacillus indicus TaxID=246786 RepID=UPI00068F0FD0|nr:glycosyltransferase family 2 protein [Metabacillus indicus]